MEIKNLEKAKDLLEEIKDLDQRIIKMDRFAMAVIENEITTSFKFSSEKIEKEPSKSSIDTDGYDYPVLGFSFMQRISREYEKALEKSETNLSIKTECSPDLTLELLGVILNAAKQRRNQLIKDLQKLGFKIG